VRESTPQPSGESGGDSNYIAMSPAGARLKTPPCLGIIVTAPHGGAGTPVDTAGTGGGVGGGDRYMDMMPGQGSSRSPRDSASRSPRDSAIPSSSPPHLNSFTYSTRSSSARDWAAGQGRPAPPSGGAGKLNTDNYMSMGPQGSAATASGACLPPGVDGGPHDGRGGEEGSGETVPGSDYMSMAAPCNEGYIPMDMSTTRRKNGQFPIYFVNVLHSF